jgi:hypothetical protein
MNKLATYLLPLGERQPLNAFSSNEVLANLIPNVISIPMDDELLGVHKASPKTPARKLVIPPAPSGNDRPDDLPPPATAWEAFYPVGSINPNGDIPGGFGLYLSGPPEFRAMLQGMSDNSGAKEAIFSYRMMLQQDWEWVKGGKLPGICKPIEFVLNLFSDVRYSDGGEGEKSYGCTGGRQEQRCKCFNLRPMWRFVASITITSD